MRIWKDVVDIVFYFYYERDNSYKVMHFCLATDVQVDKLLLEVVRLLIILSDAFFTYFSVLSTVNMRNTMTNTCYAL